MLLIGMVHLLPLPGSPRYGGSMQQVLDRALEETNMLVEAGFDGLLVENYGDVPFRKGFSAPETVAAVTRVVLEVRRIHSGLLGVQLLRNDGRGALAVAAIAGAQFVRVNVLSGAMVTDQGIIESNAASVLRYRQRIAPAVQIWADVHVKHARPLIPQPIEEAAADLVERSLADAVIVSGIGTGHETNLEDVKRVKSATSAPLIVGSGVRVTNLSHYMGWADGLIIGSSIKEGEIASGKVSAEKANQLVVGAKKL